MLRHADTCTHTHTRTQPHTEPILQRTVQRPASPMSHVTAFRSKEQAELHARGPSKACAQTLLFWMKPLFLSLPGGVGQHVAFSRVAFATQTRGNCACAEGTPSNVRVAQIQSDAHSTAVSILNLIKSVSIDTRVGSSTARLEIRC